MGNIRTFMLSNSLYSGWTFGGATDGLGCLYLEYCHKLESLFPHLVAIEAYKEAR